MKLEIDRRLWTAAVDGYQPVACVIDARVIRRADGPAPAIRLEVSDCWVDLIGSVVEVRLVRGDRLRTITGLVESAVSNFERQQTVIIQLWPADGVLEPVGKAT